MSEETHAANRNNLEVPLRYASEEETSNEPQDEEEQVGQEANSKLLQKLMDKEHKRYRAVERASKRARTDNGLFD